MEKPIFENANELSKAVIRIEPDYETFVPEDFRQDPNGYFETKGKNIKPGEIKRDGAGKIEEDPTAVKELPVWRDSEGNELTVIGKRVNPNKGSVRDSGDPSYESKVIKELASAGLPSAKLVAESEQEGTFLSFTERVKGLGWYEKNIFKEKGLSEADIENLKGQAEHLMSEMQKQFEDAGISRGWKLKDMVFDIDFENIKVRSIIPTDWERTKIDSKKLEEYKNKHGK